MGALPPRPTIAPPRTTTAPTGTSPRSAAMRASASASPIAMSSVLAGIFEVEAVHEAMQDRREQHAIGHEQDDPAEQRVDAVEELRAVGPAILGQRPHAGHEQRRLMKGVDPREVREHDEAERADDQRHGHERQRERNGAADALEENLPACKPGTAGDHAQPFPSTWRRAPRRLRAVIPTRSSP